jgi:hypothetical protein
MMNFSAEQTKLISVNIRAQGNEEAPVDAVDFKFECVVPGEAADYLLGADEALLWHDNKDRDPLYTGLTSMISWATFKADNLSFSRVSFKEADLKKFSFKPVAGGKLELVFTASITEPSDSQINNMRKMLKCHAKLVVSAERDLFDDPEEEDDDQGDLDV